MEAAHRNRERRSHRRVSLEAIAELIVSEGQWMGLYSVENLSATGGFFVGSAGIRVGERVRIWLRLPDGAPAVVVEGEILRVEPRAGGAEGLAAVFREISADAEDVIQSAILAAIERQMQRAS